MTIARRLHAATAGSGAVYLAMEPHAVDFASHEPAKFVVSGTRGTVEIPFDRNEVGWASSLLEVGVLTDKVVLTWDFKNLASYTLHHRRKPLRVDSALFDLKLIGAFLGQYQPAPKTLAEATTRAMALTRDTPWKKVWDAVQKPLACRVIPSMENEGIVDVRNRRVAYPFYEIEGTVTGRLSCRLLARGYNPHGIGADAMYKPRGEAEAFASFDYRSMEVSTLQWLSGDESLREVLDSGLDTYGEVWRKVTGQQPKPGDRGLYKTLFLGVAYGMGPDGVSSRNGWTREAGRSLVRLLHERFPKAMGYLRDVHEAAKAGPVTDCLGRTWDCRDGAYKARNRVVQSAAGAVCLEKLVLLHDNLPRPARIAFNVHDGYTLFCKTEALREVCAKVASVLESDSRLLPGLRLKVAAKAGLRLNRMAPVPSDWGAGTPEQPTSGEKP